MVVARMRSIFVEGQWPQSDPARVDGRFGRRGDAWQRFPIGERTPDASVPAMPSGSRAIPPAARVRLGR
jgi:hypothetical protein